MKQVDNSSILCRRTQWIFIILQPIGKKKKQPRDNIHADTEQLWEEILNQVLQAEMAEHLQADRYERSDERRACRHGSYERKLTTRLSRLELEVPRCDDGSFSTELFERYQRSEKALVLALMNMVVQGVSTRRVKKITTKFCGRSFTKSTVSRLTKELDKQVRVLAWASLTGARRIGTEIAETSCVSPGAYPIR